MPKIGQTLEKKARTNIGYISKFDIQTLLQQVVNFTVYASFPPMIMTVLVFYLLGKRSQIFMRGQRKIMSIDELYKSFAFMAMLADKQFKDLDTDNSGFVEVSEMITAMSEVLGPALERRNMAFFFTVRGRYVKSWRFHEFTIMILRTF